MTRITIRVARLAVPLMALWKTAHHPATPRQAKFAAVATMIYVLSPIDLLPDVVPLLGMMDDVAVVWLGVALARHWMPAALWQARWTEAEAAVGTLWPRLMLSALGIAALWLLLLGSLLWWLWRALVPA